MKALFVPFLIGLLGYLAGQRALAAEPAPAKPLLERSEDLEAALPAYGFQETRVFTWRGGILGGKINFLDGQNIKSIDLNTHLLDAARKLFRAGETFDPSTLSGVLVIAIKKPVNAASQMRHCHVSVVVRKLVEEKDDTGKVARFEKRMTTLEIKGMVPDRAGKPGALPDIAADKDPLERSEALPLKGGRKFPLYELKLSTKAPGAGKG
jgi:hypothetical protein